MIHFKEGKDEKDQVTLTYWFTKGVSFSDILKLKERILLLCPKCTLASFNNDKEFFPTTKKYNNRETIVFLNKSYVLEESEIY